MSLFVEAHINRLQREIASLRKQKQLFLEWFENGYAFNRGQLERLTGVPRSTLFDRLQKLIRQRLVTRFEHVTELQGRRTVYYCRYDSEEVAYVYRGRIQRKTFLTWRSNQSKRVQEQYEMLEFAK